MSRRTLKQLMGALALVVMTALPASAQTYAIQGGTVHTLAGQTFVGTVVVKDGRIAEVGPNVQPPAGAQVIDATGKHVYPGMFDAVTRLGLTEVGAESVTNDYQEQGDYKPQLQAATAVHPATEHIPVARANGITHAMAVPSGGVISGQGSLIGLDGWTIEEMDIDPGAAMAINYPSMTPRRRFGGFFGGPSQSFSDVQRQYEEKVAELDRWMEGGREYAKAKAAGAVQRNPSMEAMEKVVNREIPVLLEANGERDIKNAVAWAEKQNIRFVLTGGVQAWKVADMLAEKNIPVILGPTQDMPHGADAEYDEAYSNAGKLYAAGVKIAFATFNSSDSRTLPYEAAMAVPYGLPEEAAMEAVMKNGAEMLGVGDKLGTIEPGKLANLIVTDGDPLEIQTHVTDLFILGRNVSTDNKHKSLYEKYRARPKERVIS